MIGNSQYQWDSIVCLYSACCDSKKNQYILVTLIDIEPCYNVWAFFCFTDRQAHDPSTNSEQVDSANIRSKVRHLKMMMEEKKQRRKSRRTSNSPYQWPRKQERGFKTDTSSVPDCLCTENQVPTDSYSNLEKETVAV